MSCRTSCSRLFRSLPKVCYLCWFVCVWVCEHALCDVPQSSLGVGDICYAALCVQLRVRPTCVYVLYFRLELFYRWKGPCSLCFFCGQQNELVVNGGSQSGASVPLAPHNTLPMYIQAPCGHFCTARGPRPKETTVLRVRATQTRYAAVLCCCACSYVIWSGAACGGFAFAQQFPPFLF